MVLGCSLPERQFANLEGAADSGSFTADGGLEELDQTEAVTASDAGAQVPSGSDSQVPPGGRMQAAPTSTDGGASGEKTGILRDSGVGSGTGSAEASTHPTGGPSDAGGDASDAVCLTPGCEPPCATNPCENGATCRDEEEHFHCDCPAGFEGETCAVNIDDCDPNPCQNGGSCIDEVAGYRCDCAPGYGGPTCAEVLTWCQQQSPPVRVDDYSCVDFESGIPRDWTQPAEGDSQRTMDRAVSAPWAWYSKASTAYPNGALAHGKIGGAAVQSATVETQLRAEGLAGPVASYGVRLLCVEIGQGYACVVSDGLQGLSIEYAYTGPGVRGGTCEVGQSLQLGTWQSLRLTLEADAGAVALQVGGTEAVTKCEIGLNLRSSDAVFRVGVQEPSALNYDAHYDDIRVWVTR